MLPATLLLLQRSPAPTVLPATSPFVRTIGRFDLRDPAGPRSAWPATAVELRYHGRNLTFRARTSGDDYLQAVVDGDPVAVVHLTKEAADYTVPVRGSGVHTVRLVKRTEAFVGTTQLLSFTFAGKPEQSKPPSRRIEIVGDSISCGYGNEGKSQTERFSNDTENGYQAYGPIAARAVGADWAVIAWSGRKMWPDNTVPEIYDLALPTDPESVWRFGTPAPQAVVIHLATNDFGMGNPEEGPWTDAYAGFVSRLRGHYPDARIYLAMGSMMNDGFPPGRRALSTLRGYLERLVVRLKDRGDKRVALLEFPQQDENDGIGSDWHPSVRTQRKMGALLAARLRADLRW